MNRLRWREGSRNCESVGVNWACGRRGRRLCGLTFEFTRAAEAGVVSPACDDATAGTRRAYNACRSGSGVQRVVRRHTQASLVALC